MIRLNPGAVVAVGISAVLLSCEPDIEPVAPENPVPVLVRVDPPTMVRQPGAPVLALGGRDLIPGVKAHWNGAERPGDLEGDSVLRVTLAAGDVATVGSHRIFVTNPEPGGGGSRELTVAVIHPAPVVDSISPRVALALSSQGFTLDVFGSDFAAQDGGATVFWNNAALPSEVQSSTHVRAHVADNLLSSGGQVAITVMNPQPTVGPSEPMVFTLENPVPHVTGTDPSTIWLLSIGEFDVLGSHFVPGAVVWYNGREQVLERFRPTSLTVDVPWEQRVRDSGVIQVWNPGPGGGWSDTLRVTIREWGPRLESVNPDSVVVRSGPFTLTALGRYFAPDATVLWNGAPIPTTAVSDDELSAEVDEARVSEVGVAQISVENPRMGGVSVSRPLRVVPSLALASVSPAYLLVGSGQVSLTLLGRGFDPDAVVLWNGAPLPTTYVSHSELRAEVDGALVSEVGVAEISVENPRFGDVSASLPVSSLPDARVVWKHTHYAVRVSGLDGSSMEEFFVPWITSPVDVVEGPEMIFSASMCGVGPEPRCDHFNRIYAIGGDGVARRVTPFDTTATLLSEESPRTSPDGEWIYFEAGIRTVGLDVYGRPATRPELWRVRRDGTSAEAVTPGPPSGTRVVAPSVSNDGLKLVYRGWPASTGANYELEVLDLTTGDVASLGVSGFRPLWSPDDSWIAYKAMNGNHVRLVRPDGSGERPLTTGLSGTPLGFGWSPDGRFVAVAVGGPVWLVDVETGEKIPVPALTEATDISWYSGR